MSSDYTKIYDILEMAELLGEELIEGEELRAEAVDVDSDELTTVIFKFNEHQELVGVNTKNGL